MLFAVHNHHDIVKHLISIESNVSLIDYNHRTVLYCIFMGNSLSFETSPKLTTAIWKDHSAFILHTDNTGKTSWILATRDYDLVLLGIMAIYFPSVILDSVTQIALYEASTGRRISVIRFLVESLCVDIGQIETTNHLTFAILPRAARSTKHSKR
jgi:hypothetical protein